MFRAPDVTTNAMTATEKKGARGEGLGQTFLLRPTRCVGFRQDRCVKRQEATGLRTGEGMLQCLTAEAGVAFGLAGGGQKRSSIC